jgi:hypothetical protein
MLQLIVALASVPASPRLPSLESQLCADVVQWSLVNKTLGPMPPGEQDKPGHHFRLCLDTAGVRFSQHGVAVKPGRPPTPLQIWQIYDGTNMFVLQANASLPGGYHCGFVRKAQDPGSPPFTFVRIDAEATQGPSATIDGFDDVQTWIHHRLPHGHVAGGNMTWFVLPPVGTQGAQLLRTSNLVHFPSASSPNITDGQRDFHSNHTNKVEAELKPPAGVKCAPHDAADVDNSWMFDHELFAGDW